MNEVTVTATLLNGDITPPGRGVFFPESDELKAFYARLDPKLSAKTAEVGREIRMIANTSAVEVGRLLRMMKKELGYGNFGTWIRLDLGMRVRTATNVMNLARVADMALQRYGKECEQKILALPRTVGYTLGSRTVKNSTRLAILRGINSNKYASPEAILENIDEWTGTRFSQKIQAQSVPDNSVIPDDPSVLVEGGGVVMLIHNGFKTIRVELTPLQSLRMGAELVVAGTSASGIEEDD